MRANWGWINLVEPGTQRIRARGHLLVTAVTTDGAWEGDLESIRVPRGGVAPQSGCYLAWFPRSTEVHDVDVAVSEQALTMQCGDADLPAVFRELAEGE